MVHVGDLGFAVGEILHDVAHGFLGNFEEQFFDRLEQIAVGVFAIDHFRARDEHFVAFAAHLLDENGDLHFAAAADVENVRVSRFASMRKATLVRDLFDQPLPDWRAVTSLPSWPASGPSLTANSI